MILCYNTAVFVMRLPRDDIVDGSLSNYLREAVCIDVHVYTAFVRGIFIRHAESPDAASIEKHAVQRAGAIFRISKANHINGCWSDSAAALLTRNKLQ